MWSEKKKYGLYAVMACAAYLVIFLIFYIPNYAMEIADDANLLPYRLIRDALETLVGFFVPLTGGILIFAQRGHDGYARRALHSLILATPTVIYSLPYCYLLMLSNGYDSIESVQISALLTVVDTVIMAAHIFVICLASSLVCVGLARRRAQADQAKKSKNLDTGRPFELSDGCGAFDTSSIASVSVFAAVAVEFIYTMTIRIFDTASLFAGGQLPDDDSVILSVAAFVLLVLTLPLGVWVCRRLIDLISKAGDGSAECDNTAEG